MKNLIILLLLISSLAASAQRPMTAGWNEQKVKILSSAFYYPAMIYLPSDYFDAAAATKRYPIIFSFHGSGQAGSDTVSLFEDGWIKNISHNGVTSYGGYALGSDAPTANDVNGNSRTAIVVAVQATSYGVNPSWFPYMFPDVTGRLGLRVDSSMVYLYGYSAGNWAATGIITKNTDTTYNRFISGIVVNSGATQDLTPHSTFKVIADRNIPTFLFAGVSDVTYYEQMDKERDTINFYSNPDVAIFDSVPGQGHSGFSANTLNSKTWTKLGGTNIITWLFTKRNTYATTWTPSGSSSPVANAGTDQTITMPKTSVTLNGSASTGTITSIQWTKLSGGNHTQEGAITNATSLTATASNIGLGTYTYELSITDGSTTDKDTIVISAGAYKSRIPAANGEKFLLTPSGGEYYFPNILSSYPTLNGGDTLYLTQSAGLCQFYGEGTDGGWGGDSVNQVVITAAPGVELSGAFRLNGQHVKVEGITFTASGTSIAGIVLPAKHRNIEITGCTFNGSENAIYAKSVVDSADVLTYGTNWDFYGNYFHHNTIRDTRGEGMYLNHTFSDEEDLGNSDFGDYTPVKMTNLVVSYNDLRRIGWDGIQTSNAPNVTITHNTIDSTGLICKSSQLFGIIIGGYSWGRADSNDVRNTKSAGIALFGGDSCHARGNFLFNCGYADIQTDLNCATGNPFTAIYTNDNRITSLGSPSPGLVVDIQNNCIQGLTSYASGAAIESRDGNSTTRAGYIKNNRVLEVDGRLITNVIQSNTSGDDISGNTIAACSDNVPPAASAGDDVSITIPVNFTVLDGSLSNDPDGTIDTYLWTQTSGPSGATITTPTQATTTITNMVPGVYDFTLTVTDDDDATHSDVVRITVIAAPNEKVYKSVLLKYRLNRIN